MLDETLCTYDRHKKEAKKIISRITNRHYREMERNRSEGFEIVDDLKQQLRKTFCRAQTEKINKTLRRKRMTEHFLPNLEQEVTPPQRFACPQQTIQLISRRLSLTKDRFSNRSRSYSRKLTCLEQNQLDEVLLEVQDSLKQSTSDMSIEEIKNSKVLDEEVAGYQNRQEGHWRRDLWSKVASADEKGNKAFLPMLELYVQQRFFLKNMSRQQERTHSIITQMLLLALARRRNNKLLDALDILISIDSFFPKGNTHMQHLKSVWYLLISTVFLEIKASEKKEKGNRWRRDSKRSSIKAKAQMKRQKTIVIRTLASKKNFLDRVSLQLQKIELVHETSYQNEIQNLRNVVSSEQEVGKMVVSRVNKSYLLSYPEPSALFPEVEGILNYGVVLINRDKESNLFPNHFPVALTDFISQEQYVSAFCKINSVLVPETRCFNYSSSMQANFEPIFMICLILFLGVILISTFGTKLKQGYTILGLVFLMFSLVIVFSLKIHLNAGSGFAQSSSTFTSIKRILAELQQLYERDSIKFILGDNIDIIIISFPKGPETQSAMLQGQGSEGSLSFPSKLKTFKCSMNSIFLSKINQIINDSDSEGETQYDQIIQDNENRFEQRNKSDLNESDPVVMNQGYVSEFDQKATEQAPPLLIYEYKSEVE